MAVGTEQLEGGSSTSARNGRSNKPAWGYSGGRKVAVGSNGAVRYGGVVKAAGSGVGSSAVRGSVTRYCCAGW